jgi:hypothetical protein
MKKLIIAGFVVLLVIAGVLCWQYFRHSMDAKLGRQLIGTWSREGVNPITVVADGTWLFSGMPDRTGTWQVRNDVLVLTFTNSSPVVSAIVGGHSVVGSAIRYKIIQVDEHQLIYNDGAKTITLTRS